MWRMSDKTFCVFFSINRWPNQRQQQQQSTLTVATCARSGFLAFRVDFAEWPDGCLNWSSENGKWWVRGENSDGFPRDDNGNEAVSHLANC